MIRHVHPPVFSMRRGKVGKANPVAAPTHGVWKENATLPPHQEVRP